jgi:hypothetical protein
MPCYFTKSQPHPHQVQRRRPAISPEAFLWDLNYQSSKTRYLGTMGCPIDIRYMNQNRHQLVEHDSGGLVVGIVAVPSQN